MLTTTITTTIIYNLYQPMISYKLTSLILIKINVESVCPIRIIVIIIIGHFLSSRSLIIIEMGWCRRRRSIVKNNKIIFIHRNPSKGAHSPHGNCRRRNITSLNPLEMTLNRHRKIKCFFKKSLLLSLWMASIRAINNEN